MAGGFDFGSALGDPFETPLVVDIRGVVLSRHGVPVAGASVDLGRGSVDAANGMGRLDRVLVSTASDSAGAFYFSGEEHGIFCVDGLVVSAMHADYFSDYPGIENMAEIECAEAGTEVVLAPGAIRRSPRSRAILFSPDSPRVRVGQTVEIAWVVVYSDGWMGKPLNSSFVTRRIAGDYEACGSEREGRYRPKGGAILYTAPAAVPAEGECGGGSGQVRIDTKVFDGMKGHQTGAADTVYITITT